MKRWGTLLLCIALLMGLSGCIPSKELNEKLIVQAMGIDWEEGEFLVTLQVYFPEGENFIDLSKSNNQVVKGKGETISQAIQAAEISQGKEAFYGHNELIVVGRGMAQEGLSLISTFLNSLNELRPNIHLLVSDQSAGEVVSAQIQGGILPAHVLRKAAVSGEENGWVAQCTLVDVIKSLQGDGSQISAPMVELREKEEGEMEAVLERTGVFLEGKLVGELDRRETRGMLWVNNQVVRTSLTAKDERYGVLSAQVTHAHTKRRVSIQDGRAVMGLEVSMKALIDEQVSPETGPIREEDLHRIEQEFAAMVKKEMEASLGAGLTRLGSDIFDFSGELSWREPQFYLAYQKDWEEALSQLRWEIQVECSIGRLGIETK